MKVIIAMCLVAVVAAAPPARSVQYSPENVSLLRFINNIGSGGYNYEFEQSDGTKAGQSSQIINEGSEDESMKVTGYYTWIGPDKVTYLITYTADENGFKPEIEQGPGGAVPNHVATLLG